MKKTVIIALATFASLFASAARDTWVESGEMLRYRHDTYLCRSPLRPPRDHQVPYPVFIQGLSLLKGDKQLNYL